MKTIQGIYVPTVVPYLEDQKINEGELRRIVSWLIDKGVTGIYPNGSLGEFIRLSFEERKRVISIIADEARGRVPILAGAAEPNIDAVIEMCNYCADLGCEAVSITGPYYYQVSQESIEAYFREIAQRSPINIVIYNIPAFANEISVPVLKNLALDCPRIVGTKDSSKDMCRFLHVLNDIKSQRPEFSALVGWEELLVPTMMMGGDGGTLSTAGVAPEVIMKMYDTAKAKDWEQAKVLQLKILELFNAMITAPNFPSGFRAGYEMRGFSIGPARYPLSSAEADQMQEVRNHVACLLAECGFAEAAASCNLPSCSSGKQIDVNLIVNSIVEGLRKK
ncbi:MAG: dihydrodipicolinate synthase family protein [Lentimonas sp.]